MTVITAMTMNIIIIIIIQELQERVPSDPFEAELLMMAEAVASANKASNSDSESDDDTDGSKHTFQLSSVFESLELFAD